jgi:hypothetical protein
MSCYLTSKRAAHITTTALQEVTKTFGLLPTILAAKTSVRYRMSEQYTYTDVCRDKTELLGQHEMFCLRKEIEQVGTAITF